MRHKLLIEEGLIIKGNRVCILPDISDKTLLYLHDNTVFLRHWGDYGRGSPNSDMLIITDTQILPTLGQHLT